MDTVFENAAIAELPVGIDALANISANAEAIKAKAMELTDSWAGRPCSRSLRKSSRNICGGRWL